MNRAPCPKADRYLIATSRWWKPLMGWTATVGIFEHMVLLPLMHIPSDAATLYATYTMAGALAGIRGWEKLKGIAPDSPLGAVDNPDGVTP